MNDEELKIGLAETPGYRYANQVDDRLYVAGQVPNDSSGKIIGIDNPYKQTEQCLFNLNLLLKCHGFELIDIQRLTVYVVGESPNLAEAWSAVRSFFPYGVPPATILGVSALGYEGQLVEIDTEINRGSRA